ncbi:MAG: molybdopterin-binding protein, partial [Pseudomonadota bacterium]
MHGIDQTLNFVPVRIAILIVSDTRTLETDTSGATLVERLESAGHHLVERKIVTDDIDVIRRTAKAWIDDPSVDVIISSGGTGLT